MFKFKTGPPATRLHFFVSLRGVAMWDSQQIEDDRELYIAAHARMVILRHMKKDFGAKRFLRRDYWLILLFGV
jgi:hypothetical protein